MDLKEKLAELSAKLDKLKENASTLSQAETAKQLNEIKLEMSKIQEHQITSKLDNIEGNMKEMADHELSQIIVANDSKIGTKAPGNRSQGVY
jgi:hypothetical protein